MPTPFDHAPPPVTVAGLLAVPIDIQLLDATLTFDAAAERCDVDASIDFVVGPTAGNPIFDLRQTIGAAWLDGASIATGLLAHHEFGGGTDARLRVLQASLAAGSSHRLRVTYVLALPDALSSGSGPPTYGWDSGALTLKFWYTDLRAGRYLDAWLPGNLVYDRFAATLRFRILSTTVSHVLISNGGVTSIGANDWQVAFPAHFSSCSSMLRIQPASAVASRVGATTLPSGAVTIRSYKPIAGTTNLALQEAAIATRLAENEAAFGPYTHGSDFTAFFEGPGGMEYAGAVRTEVGLLRHEAFHSWYARGVQPATQDDGWWDEGWTTYVTSAQTPSPLDFSSPPVVLCTRNPWVRETHPDSYTSGSRFFRGLAALLGDTSLRAAMGAFYQRYRLDIASTLDLEAQLLQATGTMGVVDGFHHFVFGLGDAAGGRAWLRDEVGHAATDAWGGRFWDSPDLWVRNDDDGVAVHQDPATERDNWIYARIRNRGTSPVRHFMVAFAVKQFAGTQFVYPDDFLVSCVAATGGFDLDTTPVVVKARWPAALIPPEGAHACLLAAVLARGDHPTPGARVWEDARLAQKNLTIVRLDGDGWVVIPVVIGSFHRSGRRTWLEVARPKDLPGLEVTLLRPRPHAPKKRRAIADCGARRLETDLGVAGRWTNRSRSAWAERLFEDAEEIPFKAGRRARVTLRSDGGFPMLIGWKLRAPRKATPGTTVFVDLVERDDQGRILGGVAVCLQIDGSRKPGRRAKGPV